MTRSAAALFIAAVLATAAGAEPVVLSGPPLFDTGPGGGTRLAGGDFDRDGKRDFLVVHPGVSISVHRGRGDGSFAPPVTTPIPEQYGFTFATGDVNADAVIDLVVDTTVFLGNGDGSFRESATLPPLEDNNGAAAIGELTGDGKTDVLLHSNPHHGPDTISVFPGDGAGHFGPAMVTDTRDGADMIATADLDEDGRLDLVTGGSTSFAWLNTGHGTFVNPVYFPDGDRIALADFNNDGHVDRAATSIYRNYLDVSLGKGDGTFHAAVRWRTALEPEDLVAVDMNVDGRIDLVAGPAGGSTVTILLGRGDGTFEPPHIHATDERTHQLIVGDFTGDGWRDVLTMDYEGTVAFLRGNGDGTLAARRAFLTSLPELEIYPDSAASGLRLADVTGDGKPDAVLMTEQGIAALPGNGKGMFGAPIVTEAGEHEDFVTGDFTGDGELDAVVSAGETFVLFAGNGDGTFRQSTISARHEEQGTLVAGDFTGDGKLDLAMSSWRMTVYPNDGSGAFSMLPPAESGAVDHQRAVIDVNQDGRADLVYSSEMVFLSDGSGGFETVRSEPDGSSDVVGIGDLDGDGFVDIVSQWYDELSVRHGNGDGTFGPPAIVTFNRYPGGWRYSAFADMDGDGRVDLVHGFMVLFGDGRGSFTGYEEQRAPVSEIDLADLDGNGSLDIVALDSGMIQVLLTRVAEGLDRPVMLTLESSLEAPRYAQAVKYTARVATDSGYALRGAVRFDVDGKTFAIRIPDDDGKTSIEVRFASLGPHTVTATFLRTGLHASASASVQQDVIKGIAQLSLRGTPDPAVAGTPVTITLFALTTGGRPNGTAIIRDGDMVLGTIDLATTRRLTTTFTTIGTHTITAELAGNAFFESASASYQQEVTGGRRRSVRPD